MIDVIHKTCLECKSRPCFNIEGKTTALYCDKHKKENIIDVLSKKCLECKSIPRFNVEGKTTAIYCAKHKKDGMINVKDKSCLECKAGNLRFPALKEKQKEYIVINTRTKIW